MAEFLRVDNENGWFGSRLTIIQTWLSNKIKTAREIFTLKTILKPYNLFLIGILILSFSVRIINIHQYPSFHWDEGVYASSGYSLWTTGVPVATDLDNYAVFEHPILGIAIIGFPLWLIGPNFVIGRTFIVIFGVLSTYLIYLIGGEYSKRTGLLAALIFATNPSILVMISNRMLLDPLVTFFSLGALYYLLKEQLKYCTVFSALALLTKLLALGTILAVLAYIFFYKDWALRLKIRKMFIYCVAIGAIFSLFIIYSLVVGRFEYMRGMMIWQASRENNPETVFPFLMRIIISSFEPFMILGVLGGVYAAVRRSRTDLVILSFLLCWILIIFYVGQPTGRHMMFIIVILIIFSARLLDNILNREDIVLYFFIGLVLCYEIYFLTNKQYFAAVGKWFVMITITILIVIILLKNHIRLRENWRKIITLGITTLIILGGVERVAMVIERDDINVQNKVVDFLKSNVEEGEVVRCDPSIGYLYNFEGDKWVNLRSEHDSEWIVISPGLKSSLNVKYENVTKEYNTVVEYGSYDIYNLDPAYLK